MTPAISAGGPAGEGGPRRLLGLTMALFFSFGFCTVLVDTLIPKLKALFALNYAEAMLTQFCFFGAYFVMSLPAGWLLSKIGYLKGVTAGLAVMAIGCLLFTPAAYLGAYPAFLLALFILASGVTLVQVAANPLAARLGDPDKAPSRLTLAQAFNSVATMVGPIFGSLLILSHGVAPLDPKQVSPALLAARRVEEARVVQLPFLGIALALLAFAVLCWALRRWSPRVAAGQAGSYSRVLRRSRLVLGVVSIFAYVGAEVSIGSTLVNYLMAPSTLGAAARTAGLLVSVYWGLAMVGRFAGAAILQKVRGSTALAGCAIGAAALVTVSALSVGWLAAAAILAVGLFNSIMFPTIFALAIEDLGEDTPQGSGLVCLGIVGGAVVPLVTGVAADAFGLALALLVPAACYVWILAYAVLTGRSQTVLDEGALGAVAG